MKPEDRYFRFVLWSEEDGLYIGYCPDLFYGGACHSKDEGEVYRTLVKLVREEVADLAAAGKALPPPLTRPMQEIKFALVPIEAITT